MKITINTLALYLLVLTIAGCASTNTMPTQAQYDAAEQYCIKQAKADQAARYPKWFTHWIACRVERIMPMQIVQYPRKEDQIRDMYAVLMQRGVAVDAGYSRVEPIYAEWDKMLDKIGIYRGVCFNGANGSQQCVPKYGPSIYTQDKSGNLVPYQ